MIMKQINKSLTFLAAVALAFAALAVSGCYKDGTDHMSSDVRISLFPAPSDFAADGTAIDGAEEFSASVVVNRGASVSREGWSVEILEAPGWVVLTMVDITTTYPDTWGTGMHEHHEKGIGLAVRPNDGQRRSFTLRVSVPSGEFRDYVVNQEADDLI